MVMNEAEGNDDGNEPTCSTTPSIPKVTPPSTPTNDSRVDILREVSGDKKRQKVVSQLYGFIEKKQFREAAERCTVCPEEAARWIVKHDEKSEAVKWRLLPLHAAIIIRSGDSLQKALLKAFPEACRERDDQGMLALHLAFRHSASDAVVNMMMDLYPEAMQIRDAKGRVPLEMISNSSSSSNSPSPSLSKKTTHKFRTFAANLFKEQKKEKKQWEGQQRAMAEELQVIKAQLADTRKERDDAVAATTNEKSNNNNSNSNDEKDDRVEELEDTLRSIRADHERVVSMLEHRISLHDQEKSFWSQQLASATEANENSMELYARAQEEHNAMTEEWKKKHQKLKTENNDMKRKIVELVDGLDLMTKNSEQERTAHKHYRAKRDQEMVQKDTELKEIYEQFNNLQIDFDDLTTKKDESDELHYETLKRIREEHSATLTQMTLEHNTTKTTLEDKIETLQENHEKSMEELTKMMKRKEEEYETLVEKMNANHEELKKAHAEELDTMAKTHEEAQNVWKGDYENLTANHNQLKETLETKMAQGNKLQEEVERVQKQYDAVVQSHEEKETTIQQLTSTMNEMTETHADLTGRHNQLKEQHTVLTDSHEEKIKTIHQLTMNLNGLAGKHEIQLEQLHKVKEQHGELVENYAKAMEQNDSQQDLLRGTVRALTEELQQTFERLEEGKCRYQELEGWFEDLQTTAEGERTAHAAEMEKKNQFVAELEAAASERTERIGQLDVQIQKYQAEIAVAQETITEIKKYVQYTATKIKEATEKEMQKFSQQGDGELGQPNESSLNQDNEEDGNDKDEDIPLNESIDELKILIQSTIDNLQKELECVKECFDAEEISLNETIVFLKSRIDELNARAQHSQNEILKLEQTNGDLKREGDATREELETEQLKYQRLTTLLEEERVRAQTTIEERDDIVQELAHSNKRLTSDLDHLRQRTNELTGVIRNERKTYATDLEILKDHIHDLTDRLQSTTDQRNATTKEKSILKRQLEVGDKKYKSLLCIIESLRSQTSDHDQKLKNANVIYETEKSEMNGLIDILKIQVKNLTEENILKTQKISRLREDLGYN